MSRIIYALVLASFFIASCVGAKSTSSDVENGYSRWGHKYSFIDSSGAHFQGVESDRDCFPGFMEFQNDSQDIEISIYDPWGKICYHSTDISENWVCNMKPGLIYEEGIYFYRICTKDFSGELVKKDTSIGTIRILDGKAF